jgi:hypothetical protein
MILLWCDAAVRVLLLWNSALLAAPLLVLTLRVWPGAGAGNLQHNYCQALACY